LNGAAGIVPKREGRLNPPTRKSEPNSHGSVQIVDSAAITALGEDLQMSWRKILAGVTGIRALTRFPTDGYSSNIAACVKGLKPVGGRSMILPLLDRLFKDLGPIPPDAFPVTATTKAGIDNLELLQRGYSAEPRDISLSSIMDIVAEFFGLTERGINISAACTSSAIAVARGAALIALGRTEAVFVCCVDLVTEFIFSGFSALKALSPAPCRPFDVDRRGLSLGEGAGALLLMSRERALRDRRSPLGTIHGWGAANDGIHITAPARGGHGLVQAVSQALNLRGIKPEQIAAISAHGTGTIYNDHMELAAFRRIFGERKVPIYSVKGAIGHSLGAAGGIEVALGLKTLSENVVPPTVGLVNPMDEARGLVSPEPVSVDGDYLLTTNSGFGGVNAAVILGR
jgi:3-oxoacyl-[acyl-carrier-protein] synthase II